MHEALSERRGAYHGFFVASFELNLHCVGFALYVHALSDKSGRIISGSTPRPYVGTWLRQRSTRLEGA